MYKGMRNIKNFRENRLNEFSMNNNNNNLSEINNHNKSENIMKLNYNNNMNLNMNINMNMNTESNIKNNKINNNSNSNSNKNYDENKFFRKKNNMGRIKNDDFQKRPISSINTRRIDESYRMIEPSFKSQISNDKNRLLNGLKNKNNFYFNNNYGINDEFGNKFINNNRYNLMNNNNNRYNLFNSDVNVNYFIFICFI